MSEKGIVIWPAYLDRRISRKKGRRIPRKLSLKSPRLDEIAKALRVLGLEPKIEGDKAYPKKWWGEKGRVVVEKVISKDELLREVAVKIQEIRS